MENVHSFESERGNPLIDALADWLVEQALRDTPIEEIFRNTCMQLYASGIPVARAHVTFKVLHPLFRAQSITWVRDQKEVKFANYLYGGSMEPWFQSPLYHMVANRLPYLRRRLAGENAMLDFPVLEELVEQGITDYLGFLIQFGEDIHDPNTTMEMEQASGVVGSWATDRASGFTNSDLRSLRRIEQRLAVAFKINIQSSITRNILTAYLGSSIGDKVLCGQITRGDVETIHAVIWYCDMRESTMLADSTSAEEFLKILNSFFESTAGAVTLHGGEVLSFIGDAVLAIFPISEDGDATSACSAAFDAAMTAQLNMDAVNQARTRQGSAELNFGLALHVGELLFGNIGIPERVDFSVIGSVANEVARLESLTKSLHQPVLVSEAFAQNLDIDWIPAGRHSLRGVDQPVAVYAPPETGEA
jgi:adenylate cyclase